eukprot:GEMP01069749.1.p1 GENE.GEMP01069749.1~~GEMP01069749.1.p1  ORF type:complete len:251 (+),score=75.92 GEMP01069749.1:97-849(+)
MRLCRIFRAGTRTYYDVLGLDKSAKPEKVKDAYRRLAKELHPDRNPNPEAEVCFKEIQEAYATLGNDWKRALYDQDLSFGDGQTSGIEKEEWTKHWGTETPEERTLRTERYKRYANEERNDLPPETFPMRVAMVFSVALPCAIFWFTANAPNLIDQQDAPHYNDVITGDTGVKLVDSYFDPWIDRWVRLPNSSVPTVDELVSLYDGPPSVEVAIPRNLTKLRMPRTSTVAPSWVRSSCGRLVPRENLVNA